MRLNKTALVILFSGFCAAAVVAGVWGFAASGGAIAALAAAVIMLVAAQLVLFLILSKDDKQSQQVPRILHDINKRLSGGEKHTRKIGKTHQSVIRQLNDLPEQLAQPSHQQPMSNQNFNQPRAAQSTNVIDHQQIAPAGQTLETILTPSLEIGNEDAHEGPNYSNNQQLSLFLEPVINTLEMNTAFYRAELAFRTELGDQQRLSGMSEQIEADGLSGVMDMKLFIALGPVIERLAARGQLLGVICPVSRQSFANHDFLEELTRYLNDYPELARVLVIEISQANLAQLSEDGMTGLAFLAQIGATFCLGGAGLESPDLQTLSSLGFKLLDLDYEENMERYKLKAFGSNGQAAQLRKNATAASMSIIGAGLVRKAQKDILNNLIDFGRGTLFSPPRRVRTDLDETQATLASSTNSENITGSKAA